MSDSISRLPSIEPLGDAAFMLRWDERIDIDINREVHRAAAALRDDAPRWLVDVVPAYASLAVFVDVEILAENSTAAGAVEQWLRERLSREPAAAAGAQSRLVEIPMRYGGADGVDLDQVAVQAGIGRDEVIARHTGVEYLVAFLGFAPGFPYLLGLDPKLATPRLAQPRLRVPAGSVAIGGAQTGLYPREGPGGWNLIGRTDRIVFDTARAVPSLLQPGDRVRFVAVSS
jgi:KipI family sensor histidine kinase inhibitor